MAIYKFKDELQQMIQNLSGKKLEGNFETIGSMLHAYNAKWTCIVTFALTPETASVVVKDRDGKEVDPEEDGTFALKEGTYTYDLYAEGYFSKLNQELVITNEDETTGSKTVTKVLTKYCVVTFDTTPEDADIKVKDSLSAVVEPESDGTYKLKEGSYTYDAEAEGYVSKTGESLEISSGDVATGEKTIVVELEAEGI